jgi:hypothetical protein
VYSLDESRLIGATIGDWLQRQSDIFGGFSPDELRPQLIARMAPGTDTIEAYLREPDHAIDEPEEILPRRVSLLHNTANLRTLRGPTLMIRRVVALDGDRAVSGPYDKPCACGT